MNNFESFKKVNKDAIKRYSERFNKLGENVKTLGWGSKKQQFLRFKALLSSVNLNNCSILDIGCGFGDLLFFLKKSNISFSKYYGWDINKNLLEVAKKNNPEGDFSLKDILLIEPYEVADVGIMLGLLNYNLKSKNIDNMEFTKSMIEKAYSLIKKKLVVDFLSTNLDVNYPKEDFVHYHNPEEILSFGLSISQNVQIIHNYPAIPQKEFMLILEK